MAEKKVEKKVEERVQPNEPVEQKSLHPEGTKATPDSVLVARRPLVG